MLNPLIGNVSFYLMLWYFFVFAFLGWIVEIIFVTIRTGSFLNRGFLNGPVCPIYGVGLSLIITFLSPVSDKWWLLLLIGGVFATFLELITGIVLNCIFHTKWWDYSKEHFNYKGYICLEFSIIWALSILLVFYVVLPLVNGFINLIPPSPFGFILLAFFSVILILDIIGVIIELKGINNNLKELNKIALPIHNGSNKIGEKISDATVIVTDKLKAGIEKIKNTRLGKAFPAIYKKFTDMIAEKKSKVK